MNDDPEDLFAPGPPDTKAHPAPAVQWNGLRSIGFPNCAQHRPRKDGMPRLVSEDGQPIWRVSYTDKATGRRCMTLVAKANRAWAQVWATAQAKELGWTFLTIGRWHGGLDFSPSPFRASSAP